MQYVVRETSIEIILNMIIRIKMGKNVDNYFNLANKTRTWGKCKKAILLSNVLYNRILPNIFNYLVFS